MRGRLLVVDDDDDILLLMRMVLTEAGWQVSATSSGHEAINWLIEDEFDVVVTDLHMPGISGLGVVEFLTENSPDTGVVVVTSDARVDVAVESLRAGAWHFVEKPLDLERLVSVVADVAQSHHEKRSTSLVQATQAVFGTLDAHDMPSVLVDVALDVLEASRAVLLSQYSGELSLIHEAARDDAVPPLQPVEYAMVADRVHSDLEPLRLPADRARVPQLVGFHNLVAYPLVTRNYTHGMIVLQRDPAQQAFTQIDLERASVLAAQVSLALDNALLVDHLRDRVDVLERARESITSAGRTAGLARFATSLAHELQAPLAYVSSNLRGAHMALAEVDVSALPAGSRAPVRQAIEHLGYALSGADRVNRLAGDLSRLTRSRSDVVFQVSQAIVAARRLAGGRIRPEIELDLMDASVRGQPERLAEALFQLMENAHHALSAEPGEPVLVRSSVRGDEVYIEVIDRGPGIPPDILLEITEPFFTTKPAPATGLGLSVAADVAETHGGYLTLRSEVGQGTIATLVLPIASQHDELVDGEELVLGGEE